MKIKSVCFTGHRNVKVTSAIKEKLTEQLKELITAGATDFYTGGAVGWDMICERTIIELKKEYHQIKLHIVLPCPPDEQTLKWNDAEKSEYKQLLWLSDTVETCAEHYRNSCMRERNARIVELADCCICYYDCKRRRSGTGQTVRMAKEKGIKIINIF